MPFQGGNEAFVEGRVGVDGFDPFTVGHMGVGNTSLTATGIPSSRPSALPYNAGTRSRAHCRVVSRSMNRRSRLVAFDMVQQAGALPQRQRAGLVGGFERLGAHSQ